MEIDQRKALDSNDRLSGLMIDYVNGISEVKLLNARKVFADKIAVLSTKSANYSHIANKIRANGLLQVIVLFRRFLF